MFWNYMGANQIESLKVMATPTPRNKKVSVFDKKHAERTFPESRFGGLGEFFFLDICKYEEIRT